MKPGDLLLASLETFDGGSKIRPVILLDTIPPYGDFLVCAVSSQLRLEVPGLDEVISPNDEDFVSSGLRVQSLVRTGQLAVKKRSLFHGRIGRISATRRLRLVQKLCRFLGCSADALPRIAARQVQGADNPDVTLKAHLADRCVLVDTALDHLIPLADTHPVTIHKAMRHSMFAGGKRLRPVLCLAAAEACGGTLEATMSAACAVECLHTYSLIHDDLPCMDDDDFRRGVPTCHKVFGEGIAVLAGDALQALAFELVARTPANARFNAADFVLELAVTAGSLHLIGGQVADLEGEGKKLAMADLRYVHESKTAALLTTSILLGAMSAGADEEQIAALKKFGMATGLAFQVIDDILDVTQTSEKLGKSAGKDLASEKSTFPSLIGLDASREEAKRLTTEAHDALQIFGEAGQRLRQLADHLLQRDY